MRAYKLFGMLMIGLVIAGCVGNSLPSDGSGSGPVSGTDPANGATNTGSTTATSCVAHMGYSEKAPDGTIVKCALLATCDAHSYTLSCDQSTCTCLVDEATTKSFAQPMPCTNSDPDDWERTVWNTGCGF